MVEARLPRAEAGYPYRLVDAWKYGTEMLARGDPTTALVVFQALVVHEPGNLAYRQALRQFERQLRASSGIDEATAAVTLTEVWLAISQAKYKREGTLIDWDAIERAAEQGLAVHPWDADLNLELGDACHARGQHAVAAFAYRCALEAAPDRVDIRERLAALPPGV